MAFCVNIKSKEFKDTAKRLDMSESQLEQIAHEYMNTPETQNQFPSDEYIISKTRGIPEKNPSKDQMTVWNKYYSTPQVFNTREDFDKARSAALRFFSEDSIGVRNTSDGKIVMTVARPSDTEAIQREYAAIKERAIANGTFMKAPNGKPTNLTERQWLQVRSKEFKDWFGDWENNPADASAVVDENGEPLVVYHGATFSNDIKIFSPQTSYFTENKVEADKYGDKFRHPLDNSPKSIPVFLNIRNPHIFDAEGREYKNINDGNFVLFDEFLESHPEYQNESWYWKYQVGEEGLNIPKSVMDAYHKMSTSKTVRTYVSENIGKNNDGVIIRNVLDPADGNISKTVPITDYVPNYSNQIKSATDNIGTFSTDSDNIYYNKESEGLFNLLDEMSKTKLWNTETVVITGFAMGRIIILKI